MIGFKWIMIFVFGFVFLALSVVPVVAQTETPTVCLIGEHPGILDSDAQTAALLVCDELRKQGISITDPVYEAPASANAYRVVLRRLGEKIIVRLSQEKPVGTIIAERQLTLANIEEMIPAASRLVNALVHNKPIDETVDMETVTEQEARELRKISGESMWNVGILGTFVPGTSIGAEPGVEFGWSYETPAYSVGTEYRGSGSDGDEDSDEFSFYAWSIGGRYFFNKRNISPYVGGGFSIINVSYKEKEKRPVRSQSSFSSDPWGYDDDEWWYDDDSDSGLGAYGVAGIEALRLTESRLKLELRIDRPFFSLPSKDIMPITFGIFFSRNYVPGAGCLF